MNGTDMFVCSRVGHLLGKAAAICRLFRQSIENMPEYQMHALGLGACIVTFELLHRELR
jgi:uncharacterized membrane-anchored protein